jgi:hypothetical protein
MTAGRKELPRAPKRRQAAAAGCALDPTAPSDPRPARPGLQRLRPRRDERRPALRPAGRPGRPGGAIGGLPARCRQHRDGGDPAVARRRPHTACTPAGTRVRRSDLGRPRRRRHNRRAARRGLLPLHRRRRSDRPARLLHRRIRTSSRASSRSRPGRPHRSADAATNPASSPRAAATASSRRQRRAGSWRGCAKPAIACATSRSPAVTRCGPRPPRPRCADSRTDEFGRPRRS